MGYTLEIKTFAQDDTPVSETYQLDWQEVHVSADEEDVILYIGKDDIRRIAQDILDKTA